MQQIAVLKLQTYSYYNYRYIYFAAYAGTCVYLLDKFQFSGIKHIKKLYFHTNALHTTA